MNEQECIQVYETLTDLLVGNGLDWVAAQVAEQISLGRPVEREIETLRMGRESPQLVMGEVFVPQRGPKASFTVTEPYKPPERLALLIDGIEEAIVKSSNIEVEAIKYLSEEDHSPPEVQFYPDEPGSEARSISMATATIRQHNSHKLKGLLEEVRREI